MLAEPNSGQTFLLVVPLELRFGLQKYYVICKKMFYISYFKFFILNISIVNTLHKGCVHKLIANIMSLYKICENI